MSPRPSVEASSRAEAERIAREEFGAGATFSVRTVRSGGVFGFFSTERFIAEMTAPAPTPAAVAPVEAAVPRPDVDSVSLEGFGEFEALLTGGESPALPDVYSPSSVAPPVRQGSESLMASATDSAGAEGLNTDETEEERSEETQPLTGFQMSLAKALAQTSSAPTVTPARPLGPPVPEGQAAHAFLRMPAALTPAQVAPEPVADHPLPMPSTAVVAAPELAGGLTAHLTRLGVPATWISDAFRRDVAAQGTHAALTRLLRYHLPAAPDAPTGAGEVLVVLGPEREALTAARTLAARLRIDPRRVLWATPNDMGALTLAATRVTTYEKAKTRSTAARRAATPTIVAVEAPLHDPASPWVQNMIAIWRPTAVWAVVDVTRKTADLTRWLTALPQADALLLHNAEETTDPATVLGATDLPVAVLGDRKATPARWASLLCERLATNVDTDDSETPSAASSPATSTADTATSLPDPIRPVASAHAAPLLDLRSPQPVAAFPSTASAFPARPALQEPALTSSVPPLSAVSGPAGRHDSPDPRSRDQQGATDPQASPAETDKPRTPFQQQLARAMDTDPRVSAAVRTVVADAGPTPGSPAGPGPSTTLAGLLAASYPAANPASTALDPAAPAEHDTPPPTPPAPASAPAAGRAGGTPSARPTTDGTDLVSRLITLGVPASYFTGAFMLDVAARGLHAALTRLLRQHLPEPLAPPSGAGDVLVIVGPEREALTAARTLAIEQRLDPNRVLWAAPDDLGALAPASTRITPETITTRRAAAQRGGTPTLVAVAAPLRPSDSTWAENMITSWQPSAVWAVVDATRKTADLTRWLASLPRVDALLLQNASDTADPAALPAATSLPVAAIDGAPATAAAWASLLCERLEETAS